MNTRTRTGPDTGETRSTHAHASRAFFAVCGTKQIFMGLVLAVAMMVPHRTLAAGPAPVNLGSTAHFMILAGAAVTTTGGGTVNGDVGASPITGAAIGIPPSQVNGIIYAVDDTGTQAPNVVIAPALLTAAKGDLTLAYNDAAGRTPVPTGPFLDPNGGNIGGLNLVPGLYKFTATALITGADVTLTGGPDDVWIFQIGSDLQVGSGIHVILAGGALARNIFWQVGTSAVLDTSSVFKGTIIADQAITMKTSSAMEGRALAFSAGVTYNGQGGSLPNVPLTIISEHGTGTPPAGSYVNAYGATLTNRITGTETLGGTQYVAAGWSMTGNGPASGSGTNMVMIQTNGATLTWQWGTNYMLNASASTNGSVTGSANGFYVAGSAVVVTSVPSLGYHFAGWTGNVSGPTNAMVQTLTMGQARTVVAHFTLEQTMLLTIVSEHGTGTPPVGDYANAYGTTLTNLITGTETLGGTQYVATGWSMTGNSPASGSGTSMVMVQTNSAALTWQWGTNYQMSASAGPNGSVIGSANGFYAVGSVPSVAAVPNAGYHFTNWTGNVSGPTDADVQTLTMNQARTVVAHFTRDAAVQVVLTVVSAHGAGLPTAGIYTNVYGTTLTNRITGAETLGGTQYVDTGWSMAGNGPASGSGTNMVMVQTNSAVLTWQWGTNFLLNASASTNGSVAGSANGFYAAGSTVVVTSAPSLGYHFAGWTGNVSGLTNAAAQTLTMDQARTVVAHFALNPVQPKPKLPAWLKPTTATTTYTFNGWAQGTGQNDWANDKGIATMTVTVRPGKEAAITGKFMQGSQQYAFTATGYDTNSAGIYVLHASYRAGAERGDLTLSIMGDAVYTENIPMDLQLYRNTFTGATPVNGYYTVALPSLDGLAGSGYVTLTVGSKGSVKGAGKLGDGMAHSFSTTLLQIPNWFWNEKTDDWVQTNPVYVAVLSALPSTYKGGYLFGLVEFAAETNQNKTIVRLSDTNAPVRWVNDDPRATSNYGAGFERALGVTGGYYTSTELLQTYYIGNVPEVADLKYTFIGAIPEKLSIQAAEWNPGGLVISGFKAPGADRPKKIVGGVWPNVYDYTSAAADSNHDGILNTTGLAISFTKPTGIFRGTFNVYYDAVTRENPVNGVQTVTHTDKKVAFQGVVLPAREELDDGIEGRGYFLMSDKSSYENIAGRVIPYNFNWSYDFLLTK